MRWNLLKAVLLACLLAGCSHKDESARMALVSDAAMAPAEVAAAPAAGGPYMAYERQVELEADLDQIAKIHDSAEALCRSAGAGECVVLQSSVEAGDDPRAELRVRATPATVQKLIASVSTDGEIARQSSTGEDLTAPVTDAARRLQMLEDYRTRLEGLRGQAGARLEDLIQVNKELADVQGQIESITADRAQLLKRVATEVLTIEIVSNEGQGAWQPVREALENFGSNLAGGIGAMISTVAVVLPWLVPLAALVWGWRRWRARRRG